MKQREMLPNWIWAAMWLSAPFAVAWFVLWVTSILRAVT